jgi:[histone H3]-lysine4 N-trimethyltransferase ATXR3
VLPVPAACFGPSESDYTGKSRDVLQTHLQADKTMATSWPAELRKCFSAMPAEDANSLIGSPVLDVNLGRVGAVGNCLDEMFGANRIKRSDEDYTQFDNNLPPEVPTEWVQCEECLKWRRVPFHVVLDDLPDVWYCRMNFWDEPEKANCDTPQDTYDPDKESTVDCSALRDGYVEPVEVGDWKDVFCVRNKIYYEAKAVSMRPSKKNLGNTEVKFHFKGWKPNQDEWIEVGSPRIAPYHFYTDATSRTVKDQEKWQGYKNGEKAKENKKKRTAEKQAAPKDSSAKKARRKSK